MKPLHKPRHLAAVIILTVAAGSYGYLAMYDTRLDASQVRLATVAMKDHAPSLYSHDPVFGDSDLWRGHAPLFLVAMKIVLAPSGYGDLTLPFRVMSPVLTLVFLLGMYALIYRQCLNWSVSVFIAILSTTVTSAPGQVSWGIGPVAMVTPTGVCLAVLPLLVIAFLRNWNYHKRPAREARRGLWCLLVVFLCVGLLGNIELGMSMNIALVLACVYLAGRRFALRAWPVAGACLLVAAAAASPQFAYVLSLRYSMLTKPPPTAPLIFEAFRQGGLRMMFPELAGDMVDWMLSCSLLIVISIAVLFRLDRLKARNLGFWLVMFIASLTVTIVGQGLTQLSAALTGRGPIIIDFARAVPLAMLPLYAFGAQTLANLFRLSRRGHTLRWGCVALTAIWMLPSDNLRVVRHWGYEVGTAFMDQQDKPLRIRKRMRRVQRRAELQNIARWARENTDVDDIFIADDAEFRMLSRRSMIAGDDVRWVFYLAPGYLPEWIERTGELRKMLRSSGGKADAEAIYLFAIDPQHVTIWRGAKNWYAVINSDADPESDRFETIGGEGWGKHWRLVRIIRPETPAAATGVTIRAIP
ncbi:MAG: hypothetical protein QGH60_23575 [Phycisphaerae bacterium]|jgi:hypothetical protein|nr:hypothetical protein [Phycisphaerae bacterium]